MKQKDIAVILGIAGISLIIAFVLGNLVFGGSKKHDTKVQVIDSISSEFSKPDDRYFNSAAVNPTQTIQIGGSSNPQPFKQ